MSIALPYKENLQYKDELEVLIEGCIRNDRSAQAELYKLMYPKMMAMVRRYFPRQVESEEIFNNGMLKVFKKINKYGHKGSFEGWVRKIIFRCVSDYVKANVKYSKKTVLSEKEYFIPVHDADNIMYQDLLKLIQGLPDTQRMVFNMYVLEGFSHRQIGEAIGISEGTSKWHLCEARKKLKQQIISLKLI